MKMDLHSTVVLLKLPAAAIPLVTLPNLHSTVVLLKPGTDFYILATYCVFTFYCSSIKTM